MAVGIVGTGSFPKLLWPGVHTIYGDEYDRYEKVYEKIFDKMPSDKRYEELMAMAGLPLPQIKAEGAPTQYASFAQAIITRLVHTVWSLGFIITKEMQDDNQYAKDLAEFGARSLAEAMIQLKETLGANVLNNGFSAQSAHIDSLGSLALFSSSINTQSGISYANQPVAQADLSEASLEQAVIDINGLIDEAGLKMKASPRVLVVPKGLQFNARRILKSPLRVSTANNDINALKLMGILQDEPVMDIFLTASKAWFLKTSVPRGLVLMEREGYESKADNDFDTDNAKFKIMERFIFDFADRRGVYGSSGA